MSTSTNRTVSLELNNSGAWKRLMTIKADAAVDIAEAEMLTNELGILYARLGGRMKWRIVTDQKSGCVTSQKPLRDWSPETGWRDA